MLQKKIFFMVYTLVLLFSLFGENSYAEEQICKFTPVFSESDTYGNKSGLQFSDDGKSYAYTLNDGQLKVVQDGRVLGTYKEVLSIQFLENTQELRYLAKDDSGKYVLVTGKTIEYLPYPEVYYFRFSESGKSYAYTVPVKYKKNNSDTINYSHAKDKGYFLVENNEEGKYIFSNIYKLKFVGDNIAYSGYQELGEKIPITKVGSAFEVEESGEDNKKYYIVYQKNIIGESTYLIEELEYSAYTQKFSYTTLGGEVFIHGEKIENQGAAIKILLSQTSNHYDILFQEYSRLDDYYYYYYFESIPEDITTKVYIIDQDNKKTFVHDGPFRFLQSEVNSELSKISLKLFDPVNDTQQSFVYQNNTLTEIEDEIYFVSQEKDFPSKYITVQDNFLRVHNFDDENLQTHSTEILSYLVEAGFLSSGNAYFLTTESINYKTVIMQHDLYVQDCGTNIGEYFKVKALLYQSNKTKRYVSKIDALIKNLSYEQKERLKKKIEEVLTKTQNQDLINIALYMKYSL